MTGFNLPPGCSAADIERAAGGAECCECCGHDPEDCICPECLVCGEQGNPKCYEDANFRQCKPGCSVPPLSYNRQQRLGQISLRITAMQDHLAEDEMFAVEAAVTDKACEAYISDENFESAAQNVLDRYDRWLKG